MRRRRQATRQAPTLVSMALVLCFGCTPSSPPVVESGGGTVTIEIIRGETTTTYDVQNVAAGTTVESVMRSIDQIPVTIHGSGVTAFVDTIGELSTGSSEGWTFKVDGKFANEGIGSTTLMPPTTITWSYGDASAMAQD